MEKNSKQTTIDEMDNKDLQFVHQVYSVNLF